jgi:hypothetical protein
MKQKKGHQIMNITKKNLIWNLGIIFAGAILGSSAHASVESFRVICGAQSEETQKLSGTQAVSLLVKGDPNLKDVQTTVPDDVSTSAMKRPWSLYMDGHHDGDATQLIALNGDGYRIKDKIKANSKYGPGFYRVVEIKGISACLKLQGGRDNGTANSKSKATAEMFIENGKGARESKKKFQGCYCEFENKAPEA